MSRDLEYERNNIGYDLQYPIEEGGGIKCKNYILCGEVLPNWWYECKGGYLCTNCDIMFGTWGNQESGIYHTGKGVLSVMEAVECPICLEINKGISNPNCDHTLCIKCFKRCYYGENKKMPPFPYSENIENEYDNIDDGEDLEIFINNHPLIRSWNEECNRLNNIELNQYANEKYLHKFPICRK